MAELADALDSGSNGRKAVQVQVLLPAPKRERGSCSSPFSFLKKTGLEVGAVVNDSPVDCQSRERPSRAVRGANQVLSPAPLRA